MDSKPGGQNQWILTPEERRDWLKRRADWRPNLPEAERLEIETKYDDDAIKLAIASGFN
ncbi:MAG: hypothetical protein QM774_11165 [Gordonia sp. (in: high G+C Gram-positive bacteria)]|uniref:hypothetical protein n=1 Tax=Gordonia sp. (in: high G+C Gram-positive bacteria) TaxID=84139 RepID=UPI0039E5E58C